MRNKIFLMAILSLLAGAGQARTWTSADGNRTFEGELKSYDADTGTVTVIVNGMPLEFPQDKLSAADVEFLKNSAGTVPSTVSATAPASSVMSEKMAKVKLSRLDGKRYRRAELEKAPEYYVLYYSASW